MNRISNFLENGMRLASLEDDSAKVIGITLFSLSILSFFKWLEPVPLHQNRSILHLELSSDAVNIDLPEQDGDLNEALFPLHRQIESQYQSLPWPDQMQNIVVLTGLEGGRGDIAASAKTIDLMQRICPKSTFDWVIRGSDQYNPISFLNCSDPSKVRVRYVNSQPLERTPGEFLLTGPTALGWGIDYTESCISRKIAGPAFGFLENAHRSSTFSLETLKGEINKSWFTGIGIGTKKLHQILYSTIFPSKSNNCTGFLPMGLQPGSGVFLDQSRIEAPLSRGYCCPSYLPKIKDAELRKDILEAMNVFDDQSEPDYDQYSFNSGYAHHSASWGKFIDCVAIHESNKHVVIVLNQRGEYAHPSVQEFQDDIFTSERLTLLKKRGYGTVIFKGEGSEVNLLQQIENLKLERRLIVITRPSFSPGDMRCMQLASERLLATGDNSAVESWCARCKLYLYEDIANMGCKWRFLQQQVDLAQAISPNLGRLLALFGGDKRLPNTSLNQPLNEKEMVEMERLLSDVHLSDATLQFCDRIASSYSFPKVLEGALKRAAWH